MSILVVGSVAFDNIATPSGRVENVLGGAATHFALAASFFTEVRVVAVVGDDFLPEHEEVLKKRGIDTRGIERAPGKTFRWGGHYTDNLNEAKTDFTALNVFEKFRAQDPKGIRRHAVPVPGQHSPITADRGAARDEWRPAHRRRHHEFLDQRTPRELAEMLSLVDVLLINDTEAKMIAHENNLPRAAQKVLAMGPRALVIKHGEYGATIFFREGAFGIGHHPFPRPRCLSSRCRIRPGRVIHFAGGFMGYIASQGEVNREVLKHALFYGGVMGSLRWNASAPSACSR